MRDVSESVSVSVSVRGVHRLPDGVKNQSAKSKNQSINK